MKLQNPDNKAFAQMFQMNYAAKILECHLKLLNAIRIGEYLPDRVVNLILQYLSNRSDIPYGIHSLIIFRNLFRYMGTRDLLN